MTDDVVVLGSGYAGTGAVKRLESVLDGADLTWISDVDHHFVLHESHRCIRDPAVKDKITFPVETLKSPATRFIEGRVVDVDVDARELELADGAVVSYDYLVIGIGSQTAFFGIEGLREHALTLKNLEDALEVHETLAEAAREASRSDPAQVVVGGAGLSGIQSAGEIAAFRDTYRAPIEIHLVEGLDRVYPNHDPIVQSKLRELLEEKDITVHTGEFVGEADANTIYGEAELELNYDVLLWTGGITGHDVASRLAVERNERNDRIEAASTFRTSDDRVFALGDAALVDQPGTEQPVPPTAQAAWQAAEVAAENVARTISGEPLEQWTYEDLGTLISVGNDVVAHNVVGVRSVADVIGGRMAEQLKKAAAMRWIRKIAGTGPALRAYPDM